MSSFNLALAAAVDRLTQEFRASTADGFDVGEAFDFFFSCLGELTDLSKDYLDAPDAETKRAILSSLRLIYKRNNPDLPLIPEPFESLLESLLLHKALPAAYDWIVQRG